MRYLARLRAEWPKFPGISARTPTRLSPSGSELTSPASSATPRAKLVRGSSASRERFTAPRPPSASFARQCCMRATGNLYLRRWGSTRTLSPHLAAPPPENLSILLPNICGRFRRHGH
eukprot:1196001-Prorocentrum_minimum.AAC.6